MEKKMGTTASLFGAALTSMLVAPELQADVVSLSFSPGTIPFPGGAFVFINEVGATFFQYNDTLGRTMFADFGGAGLSSIAVVRVSQTLLPNTFTGYSGILFSASSFGTQYVGFRFGGNVGWFSFSVAGFGTTINYLDGRYGNAGEVVHVPAPGALALLALGAVGVRRNRKRAA